MGISFTKPFMLLLIPIFIGYILCISKRNRNFKKCFIIGIRSIIISFLIFALAGMGIDVYTDTTTTIFAADVSDSIYGNEGMAEDFIKKAVGNKSEKDYAGIIAFGGDAVVEVSPAKEVFVENFTSYVDREATDIEKALKASLSVINGNSDKRIILITDGIETQGNAEKSALSLLNGGLTVDAFMLEGNLEHEVQVSGISTPGYMDKNTMYDIEVSVESLEETEGVLRIYKGSNLAVEESVVLRRGENNFLFSDISDEGGGIIYRCEIEVDRDTYYENNVAYSYTYIEDTPSVLIVENENGSGEQIEKLLESSKIRTELMRQSQVPESVETLNRFDAVIMADVSAENVSKNFLLALESFVKTTGGGFLSTGGENSYGPGEYGGTILEEILPVDMDIETEGEKPDLGMVMVIDRSGSMTDVSYGISRIEMAKEAASRAVMVMEDGDSVGVIGFDDKPVWYADMQKIEGNADDIISKISVMQAGGGTSIFPALKEAFDVLNRTDCKTKHIILLTDGQAERSGYESLLNDMRENGITLSTVAVGSGADTSLLNMLAESGGGRYYFTNAFTDLPQIFAKETNIAGKEFIRNADFYPKAGDASAILNGVDETAMLRGYVRTVPKPRADVILKSDNDEPILASWQYGLGRTAAWCSDVDGNWSGQWLNSDVGAEILRNTISWIMRSNVSQEVVFSAYKNGNVTTVKAEMPYESGIKSVSAVIAGADNSEVRVEMDSVSPGVYEGKTEEMSEGGYIISLLKEMEDGSQKVERGGFSIPYPKEYDIRNISQGRSLIEKLTSKTGGRILNGPEEAFEAHVKTVYETRELFTPLVSIAVILFLFEIAFRRFAVLSDSIEKFLSKYFVRKTVPNVKLNLEKNEFETRTSKENVKKKKEENVETNSTVEMLIKSKNKRK